MTFNPDELTFKDSLLYENKWGICYIGASIGHVEELETEGVYTYLLSLDFGSRSIHPNRDEVINHIERFLTGS